MSSHMLAGSCRCGAVRYAVADAFATTGDASAASPSFARIARDKLLRLAAETDLLIEGDPGGSHDVHCRHCGVLLYAVVGGTPWVEVALDTLLEAPTVRADPDIFAGAKPAWDEMSAAGAGGLADGLGDPPRA